MDFLTDRRSLVLHISKQICTLAAEHAFLLMTSLPMHGTGIAESLSLTYLSEFSCPGLQGAASDRTSHPTLMHVHSSVSNYRDSPCFITDNAFGRESPIRRSQIDSTHILPL